jgi:hypothetical protein
MSNEHPCLEVPPHLKRRDRVDDLPPQVSFLRKLFLRIRK